MDDTKESLAGIVGKENIIDSPQALDAYAKDQSFARARRPKLVVKPKDVDEVQKIVEWANQTHTPLVPVSSGPPHFRGDTIPETGGAVVVDLGRMDRIIKIDPRNRIAMIEPGVKFGQLQTALAKEGLKASTPLMPRSSKSVIGSVLEREPILIPRYSWTLPDPLRCVEVVWGNGQRLWTGDAGMRGSLEDQAKSGMAQSVPMGPMSVDYHRLLSAAQGSMGIVTWATVKCEILPKVHDLLLVPAEKPSDLLDFGYEILRLKYGDEILFLNKANLACIFGEGPKQVQQMKKKLPEWVLIIGVAGREYLPQERVEFQKKDIAEIARGFKLKFTMEMAGINSQQILDSLFSPSKEPYWKLRYRGSCQDIFFLTTLDKTPAFIETAGKVAQKQGYPVEDIGIYLQPAHHGTACHCEFNLPFDPANKDEKLVVEKLLKAATKAFTRKGAFFSRPYGAWADMVYSQDPQTASTLNKVKNIFDPNHIMNPGKLCFKA